MNFGMDIFGNCFLTAILKSACTFSYSYSQLVYFHTAIVTILMHILTFTSLFTVTFSLYGLKVIYGLRVVVLVCSPLPCDPVPNSNSCQGHLYHSVVLPLSSIYRAGLDQSWEAVRSPGTFSTGRCRLSILAKILMPDVHNLKNRPIKLKKNKSRNTP